MPVTGNMSLTALSQLKKIMGMTTSTNDGERLAAITAANKLLAANNFTWDMVLSKAVVVDSPMEAVPGSMNDEERNEAISQAFYRLKGSSNSFIQSLKEQYERTGFLSKAQRASLFETAERVK